MVQKPVLNVGDAVFSAWWPDEARKEAAAWYPGVITTVTVDESVNYGYGALRLYGIQFDDGDVLADVSDAWVFPKDEYELLISKQWDSNSIRCCWDDQSEDLWAKFVGWYEVSAEGRAYSLLRDAVQACKTSTAASSRPTKSVSGDNASSKQHINASIPHNGVIYNKARSRYRVEVKSGSDRNHLGYYLLQSDAALAYDKGAEIFKTNKSHERINNFETSEEYTKARELEMRDTGFSTRDVGTPADILQKIQQRILEIQQPEMKAKKFTFIGLKKNSKSSSYKAHILSKYIGSYTLQSDAAFAYDQAARRLKATNSKLNFKTKKEYVNARETEVKQKGISAESLEVVDARIKEKLNIIETKIAETAEIEGMLSMFLLTNQSSFRLHFLSLLCQYSFTQRKCIWTFSRCIWGRLPQFNQRVAFRA